MKSPVYYFAYGSNLCSVRLRQRVPSAQFISQGQLLGYRLRFNKVGLDGSGKGNIEQTGQAKDTVWGGVFQLAQSEVFLLDNAESSGVGYEQQYLSVLTPQGSMTVFTYVAILKRTDLRPFHWYKAYIVQGALEHDLPESYTQKLKTVLSIPDPDVQRCQQHISLPDIAQLHREFMLNNGHKATFQIT